MIRSIFFIFIFSLQSICFCATFDQFPDLGGLANFSHSKTVHDTLLILTNPKSGSHLLCYSIMKITKRPMRGRLIVDHFLHDPACFAPENVMNYPLDFTQPTTYFGHEYTLLMKLNRNRRNFDVDFSMWKSIGRSFLSTILPIYEKRVSTPFSSEDKDKKLSYRGHYAEFNLVYDRGTQFGFASKGNGEEKSQLKLFLSCFFLYSSYNG